ncbi:MAG: hypothetical protein IJ545_04380 [Alphaproteobacteria bacterium]|nr:hypothetical protein [Alphaproteobacteria bacterium]
MVDSVIQTNLLLWDKVFQDMKTLSFDAFQQRYNFLSIHYTFRQSFPYIDNMVLFCNECLNGQIETLQTDETDIFTLADLYRRKIDEIHNVIVAQKWNMPVKTDFYDDAAMNDMGKLLYKINRLPSRQGYVQRYFLESILLGATAVECQRKAEAEMSMTKNISRSDIPEKIMDILLQQGIQMTEQNEESVYELVCQTCGEILWSRKPAVPSEINKKLSQVFQDSFNVSLVSLPTIFQDQSEQLCHFIKETRLNMRRPQVAVRNLMLFAQNLEPIPHNDAEKMIYILMIPQSASVKENSLLEYRHIPEYIYPFMQTDEFKQIQQQMPYWDNYEKNSQKFDKRVMHVYAGVMALSWLRHLYQDLNSYEEMLDLIAEQKQNEEDDPKLYKAHTKDDEEKLLFFAQDLLAAANYSEKYLNFSVNKTGIEKTTIDKMIQKDTLNQKDISILEEMFRHIGRNLDDGIDVMQVAEVPDYSVVVNQIVALPHCPDKLDALICTEKALDVLFGDMYELMESSLFDIDCMIGRHQPQADALLTDFIRSSKEKYSDLDDESAESLSEKIHTGVVAAYLLPMYQNVKTNDKQKDAALAFIDNYEDMTPETQKFLFGLTQYYVPKVISHHPIWQPEEYSPEFIDALSTYSDAQVSLRYITDLQDTVEPALAEEKELASKYHKYQTQKAFFELPKNFDLMVAAHFAKVSQQQR